MDSPHKMQIKHGSVPWAAQSMNCPDPWLAHNIHTQEKQSSQRLHLKWLYALLQRLRLQQESTFQKATHFLSSCSSPLGRQQSEPHTKPTPILHVQVQWNCCSGHSIRQPPLYNGKYNVMREQTHQYNSKQASLYSAQNLWPMSDYYMYNENVSTIVQNLRRIHVQ